MRGARLIGRALRALAPAHESIVLIAVALPAPMRGGLRRFAPHLWSPVPRHITLMYPFVPPSSFSGELEAAMQDVVGRHLRFDFTLGGAASFPGVLYLKPEPAATLLRLIDDMEQRWPDYPRYNGSYPTNVPHVTIRRGGDSARVVERLSRHLPIHCSADEVQLWHRGWFNRWVLDRRFRLAAAGEPGQAVLAPYKRGELGAAAAVHGATALPAQMPSRSLRRLRPELTR